MKTKIIYISGGETFEMAQIRAAFEEVRATLGLDSETVLFGVPVDCDNALADNATDEISDVVTPVVTETIIENVVSESEQNEITDIIPTPIISEIPTNDMNEPAQTPKKKGRARKNMTEGQVEVVEDVVPESEVVSTDDADKVIPILSILASKSEDAVAEETVAKDVVDEVPAEETVSESAEEVLPEAEVVTISDISLDAQLIAPASDEVADNIEKITIGDMIEDAAPVTPVEKTLEQLLESMTPLREDHNSEEQTVSDNVMDEQVDFVDSDTDATLAQLASEFVQNEDKIVSTPKAESQGKIGKLKNILPFKKAKRDDSSLMGDLFGWAGIAANDEDFSMPGFFTPARKQGS